MDGCSRDCTHVVLYELRNAIVFADALVMLCNTLWSCLHFNYIYCCCLHFVMHLWCCLHFVMDLWCCLGPGKIYILLFVSMFSKCRELTENKYKKKAERVFAYSLLTAKPMPLVGWRQRRTRGDNLCNLATLRTPNFPRFLALPSVVLRLWAKRGPRFSALTSAVLRLWAKRGPTCQCW